MAEDRSQGDETPRQADTKEADGVKNGKGKKRGLFGLGKKKTEEPGKGASSTAEPPSTSRETSNLSSATRSAVSPSRKESSTPATPNRAMSTSPRVASPARSQIFERDVQDSTVAAQSNSPAIPTHIKTENHIPPVLDDASEAITNEKLDPDSVEIVTHNSHQPASVTVTGTASPMTGSAFFDSSAAEWAEELSSFANREPVASPDSASNYGSLDSADVRRLSFISFADVVQSEHTGGTGLAGSRDSIQMAGLTSLPPSGLNRSPSPIRSPVSSQGGPGTSPPTSNPASLKGVEMSPTRKPIGSPVSGSQNLSPGDLNVETMSQALRRTGSTDLSNVRSVPTSPIEGPTV